MDTEYEQKEMEALRTLFKDCVLCNDNAISTFFLSKNSWDLDSAINNFNSSIEQETSRVSLINNRRCYTAIAKLRDLIIDPENVCTYKFIHVKYKDHTRTLKLPNIESLETIKRLCNLAFFGGKNEVYRLLLNKTQIHMKTMENVLKESNECVLEAEFNETNTNIIEYDEEESDDLTCNTSTETVDLNTQKAEEITSNELNESAKNDEIDKTQADEKSFCSSEYDKCDDVGNLSDLVSIDSADTASEKNIESELEDNDESSDESINDQSLIVYKYDQGEFDSSDSEETIYDEFDDDESFFGLSGDDDNTTVIGLLSKDRIQGKLRKGSFIKSNWTNVREAITQFNMEFNLRFKEANINFLEMSLGRAIRQSIDKYLCIYLHNDSNECLSAFSYPFNIFLNDDIKAQLLGTNKILLWAWDLTLEENQQKFFLMFSKHFDSVAAAALLKHKDTLPVLLITKYSRGNQEIIHVFDDPNADRIVNTLRNLI